MLELRKMSSAEERKKAREAYLLQLNQERQTQKPQPLPPPGTVSNHHHHHLQQQRNDYNSYSVDRKTETNRMMPDNQIQSRLSNQNYTEKRMEERHYAPPQANENDLRERKPTVREDLNYHDYNQRRNDVRENRTIVIQDQSASMHPDRRLDIKERLLLMQQEDQLNSGHQSYLAQQPIRQNYHDSVNPPPQLNAPLQQSNAMVQEPAESRSLATRNPLFSNPMDDEKAIKRQKQQEYANQLKMQQDLRKAQDVSTGKPNMSHEIIVNKQPIYLNVVEKGNEAAEESLQKRKKQEEYARMLQEQMQMKQLPNDSNYGSDQRLNNSKRNQHSNNAAAEPQLAEGWVIGPLGIPVRKTLETGHRGIQKTYHQQIGSNSPQKIPPPDNFNYRNEGVLSHPSSNVAVATHPSNNYQESPTFNGIVLSTQEERDLRAKQMKMMHIKALEEQIAEKQRLAEEAKRKEAQLALLEQQRLEQEQLDIQRNFEREKQKQQQKLEEAQKIEQQQRELFKQYSSKEKQSLFKPSRPKSPSDDIDDYPNANEIVAAGLDYSSGPPNELSREQRVFPINPSKNTSSPAIKFPQLNGNDDLEPLINQLKSDASSAKNEAFLARQELNDLKKQMDNFLAQKPQTLTTSPPLKQQQTKRQSAFSNQEQPLQYNQRQSDFPYQEPSFSNNHHEPPQYTQRQSALSRQQNPPQNNRRQSAFSNELEPPQYNQRQSDISVQEQSFSNNHNEPPQYTQRQSALLNQLEQPQINQRQRAHANPQEFNQRQKNIAYKPEPTQHNDFYIQEPSPRNLRQHTISDRDQPTGSIGGNNRQVFQRHSGKLLDLNKVDEELLSLEKTLESQSRFVFPDGSVFSESTTMPKTPSTVSHNSASARTSHKIDDSVDLFLQDFEDAQQLEHQTKQNELTINSPASSPADNAVETDNDALNVEQMLRRNRRKLQVLQQSSVVNEDLLQDLKDISSTRPTTTETQSRPITQQSKLDDMIVNEPLASNFNSLKMVDLPSTNIWRNSTSLNKGLINAGKLSLSTSNKLSGFQGIHDRLQTSEVDYSMYGFT